MTHYVIRSGIHVGRLSADLLNSVVKAKNVVIVASRSVYARPRTAQVLSDFGSGRDVKVFTNITPDAHLADLEFILSQTLADPPEHIIAIGGGSVIDASKALSVCYGGESLADLFHGRAGVGASKVPLFAIPTTAGTGAELSYGAILYDPESKRKRGLRGAILVPDEVLIDHELYESLPRPLVAEVGFDALTHAIETYVSRASNPVVKYQSVAAIRTLFGNLPAYYERNDDEAREKVAIAAAMMGVNLANSSTCLPHRLQYIIGPATGTSHAQGLAALYKGWLRVISASDSDAFEILAGDLGKTAAQLIDDIFELRDKLDITYDLTGFGLSKEDLKALANTVEGRLGLDPFFKDESTVHAILRHSL